MQNLQSSTSLDAAICFMSLFTSKMKTKIEFFAFGIYSFLFIFNSLGWWLPELATALL